MNAVTPEGGKHPFPLGSPPTGAASPGPAVASARAQTSPALDVFSASKPIASAAVGDLRRLTAGVEASRIASEPQKRVDVMDIPFGVELEMEAEPKTYWFTVNEMKFNFAQSGFKPWNVHPKLKQWKIERDDSLTRGRSAESVSPVMNLRERGVTKGKAEEEIERIYAMARSLKGHTTHKCGLHIHVDAKVLGEKGLARLFRMCMENESALFKLSQNGEPQHRGVLEGFGWRHGKKYYYSRPFTPYLPDPFPLLHASGPNELGHSLYTMVPPSEDHERPPVPDLANFAGFKPDRKDSVRYFGVNFNSYWFQGTVEFRLFNATNDSQQVLTDVQLVLGMVAAAADGSYSYMRTQPLDVENPDKPVSRESFDYFLSQVSRFPGVRQKLEASFEKGGGKLADDPPVQDPHVLSTAQLLARGYQFRAEGKDIVSPFEVVEEIKKGARTVELVAPNGRDAAPLRDVNVLAQLAGKTA